MDWERHDTRAEAEECAEQLSRKDEKYVVEQFDQSCVHCKTLTRHPAR
jgi:hypothetical protein